MNKTISITHAIYGQFDERRLLLSIQSIQCTAHPLIEIIVAEQNTIPKFSDYAKKLGVKYNFSRPKKINGNPLFNPGEIRNNALKLATGNYIYTNDSDVVFPNKDFFGDIINLMDDMGNTAFQRPQMTRLIKESFESFYDSCSKVGIEEAINQLYKISDYEMSTEQRQSNLKIVNRRGTIFTIDNDDFERYMNTPSLKGHEPTIWHASMHCGGTFAKKEQIEAVKGYSTAYKTWGFEDSDIQWKLSQIFPMEFFPNEEKYKVMHLDHPKGYFDAKAAKMNENTFNARKLAGINKAIEHDSKYFGGLGCRDLKD